MELLTTITQWHWFGLAAILGILEVVVGASFFLLWLAICAILVAIMVIIFPLLEWQLQLLIFALASITSIFFWHVHLKNNPSSTNKPTLNRRNEQYIGRIFVLTEPIVNGRGRIQVDDTFWLVEGADLPVGSRVRVIDVNGVILQVAEVS